MGSGPFECVWGERGGGDRKRGRVCQYEYEQVMHSKP